MGTVYLGRADSGGPPVAVKVVHPELAGDPEFRARFADEVAAARRVAPFCTARVVDADPAAHPPWLVTEYVDGVPLSAAVAEGGPLDPSTLHGVALGVAAALAAVHAAGVVHRDLKPGNVLLSLSGPRVIDFGIARRPGRGPGAHPGRDAGRHARLDGAGAVPGWGGRAGVGRLQLGQPGGVRGDRAQPVGDRRRAVAAAGRAGGADPDRDTRPGRPGRAAARAGGAGAGQGPGAADRPPASWWTSCSAGPAGRPTPRWRRPSWWSGPGPACRSSPARPGRPPPRDGPARPVAHAGPRRPASPLRAPATRFGRRPTRFGRRPTRFGRRLARRGGRGGGRRCRGRVAGRGGGGSRWSRLGRGTGSGTVGRAAAGPPVAAGPGPTRVLPARPRGGAQPDPTRVMPPGPPAGPPAPAPRRFGPGRRRAAPPAAPPPYTVPPAAYRVPEPRPRRRWWRRKRLLIPLALLVLLAFLPERDPAPAAPEPGLGEPVRDGQLEFVVRDVRCGVRAAGQRASREEPGRPVLPGPGRCPQRQAGRPDALRAGPEAARLGRPEARRGRSPPGSTSGTRRSGTRCSRASR